MPLANLGAVPAASPAPLSTSDVSAGATTAERFGRVVRSPKIRMNENPIMSEIKVVEGDFANCSGKYALIVGRWNSFVVESLKQGALDTLRRHGIPDGQISIYYAPGAFEFPLLAKRLALKGEFDAIIALGAVIRGGTPHFEYVAGECTKGLAQVSLNENTVIAFGVLTVDSIEQAIERAGTKAGNKGVEAASTALEMVSLLARV